ncbi:tyrosyl-DNA phosphodiesterase 2 isoform X1 [Xenopus tropicalis]|uniref:Tyrosyl-DNA phosphodiesterase 2 n=1 Tax=Xenopus tropicalis TaxID=8364 RepID=A0A8J1JN01_XENTR|nr:tyrosyl-DNA phosphodiesterase 2 isoform X1 [Xenopus tropicalis]
MSAELAETSKEMEKEDAGAVQCGTGEGEAVVLNERSEQCSAFASIAGCDERAINSFFEPGVESALQNKAAADIADPLKQETMSGTASDSCIDLTGDDLVVTKSEATTSNSSTVKQEDESHFSFLTWNIDGLDESNVAERARGVCSYLALYSPDVVFLQEVIPPYYEYLKKRAVSYTIITGNEDEYFTAMMLKKSRVKLISQEIVPYPSTVMMRNLLVANVNISGNSICLMTSHLESTKDHSKERLKQLDIVLKKMMDAPPLATVIFGGDTNLRDQEVAKIGGMPNNILDVWDFLGKPEHCRYTWDTKVNKNLRAPYICRLRFDRIFFRASQEGSQVIPQSLYLAGTEKLDCGRFPSDHWGLLCDFAIIL